MAALGLRPCAFARAQPLSLMVSFMIIGAYRAVKSQNKPLRFVQIMSGFKRLSDHVTILLLSSQDSKYKNRVGFINHLSEH